IQFAHRGRAGIDTMSILAGPPGGPYANLGYFADGNAAWRFYSGVTYVVPAGQYTTRVLFQSVYTAGGPSIGNFLDDAYINFHGLGIVFGVTKPSCGNSHDGS